jgi:hypothetical protein
MGYASGEHQQALFATGIVLFIIIMILNATAEAGNYLKSIFTAHVKTAEWLRQRNIITMKAMVNEKYVCVDTNQQSVMVADRSVADTWEKYEKITNSDGTISLCSLANNKYVCADLNQSSKLIARSDSIDSWEKFKVVDMGSGNIALQSLANNKYVSCDRNNRDDCMPIEITQVYGRHLPYQTQCSTEYQ